jgi:hypothetical protein
MVSLWRYVICGVVCTTLLTALMISSVSTGSAAAAFWLLFPAVWLTNTAIGPLLTTSNSGLEHLIAIVLTSSLLNSLFYTAIFLALSKLLLSSRRAKLPQRQATD